MKRRSGSASPRCGACGNGNHAAPDAALPAWDKTLPPASVMGTWRGLSPARGIVHLHSPYSHDACDNMPRDAERRRRTSRVSRICARRCAPIRSTSRISPTTTRRWPTRTSRRCSACAAATSPVIDGDGDQIAIADDVRRRSRRDVHGRRRERPDADHAASPSGRRRRSPRATRSTTALDAATVQAFRDAGGLTWIAHTEQHDIDQLRTLLPDGIELYNLHANIDPNIRSMYLGLDSAGAITAAVQLRRHATGSSRARSRAAVVHLAEHAGVDALGSTARAMVITSRRPPAATRTRTRCPSCSPTANAVIRIAACCAGSRTSRSCRTRRTWRRSKPRSRPARCSRCSR